MTVLLSPVRSVSGQALLLTFLESGACPAHTMNFYQLDGYLRAIASGPGSASPVDFLPLVFNGQQPHYVGEDQKKEVTDAIWGLYTFHAEQVLSGQLDLPCVPVYSAIRNDRIDLEQWARGFMQGYIFWDDAWNTLLDGMPHVTEADLPVDSAVEELDEILRVISILADADLALQQGTKSDELVHIFASLPEMLINYAHLGQRVSCNLLMHTITNPLVDKCS